MSDATVILVCLGIVAAMVVVVAFQWVAVNRLSRAVARHARDISKLREALVTARSTAAAPSLSEAPASRKARRAAVAPSDLEGIFRDFYLNNRWGNPESKSGAGSTLRYTEPLRGELPVLLRRFGIKSMIDAPCGDFNWMKEVRFDAGFTYIGGDIVGELAEVNAAKYSSSTHSFRKFNIVTDEFPDVDLWFCRGLLAHLPYSLTMEALQNYASSRIGFVMISSHINDGSLKNKDVSGPGVYRPLDMRSAPFGFPAPLAEIKDFIEGYPPRNICLWTREQIATALADAQSSARLRTQTDYTL